MAGELAQIRADAATDLEHVVPGVLIELHEREHPRGIDAVAVCLDFLEPLERVRLGGLRVVGPDGVVIPLVLDLLLVGIARGDAPRLNGGSRSRRQVFTHEAPHVAHMPGPGKLVEHGLPGVSAQRHRHIGALDQPDDPINKFVNATWRA